MLAHQNSIRRRMALLPLIFLLVAVPGVGQAAQLQIGGTGAALGAMRVLFDAFRQSRPGVEGEVLPSLGSSGGIKALKAGAIDLAVAGRPLKDKERAPGVQATPIGTTAVVFAVAASNPTSGLSAAEILDLYRGEQTHWPDGTPVRLVLRPDGDSGTRVIKHHVPGMAQVLGALRQRPEIPIAYTDQESADQLEGHPGALGTADLSVIVAERRRLKALTLDGVHPSNGTVADGSYRLTKTFYLVTTGHPSAVVRSFLAFVRSPEGGSLLRRNGLVPVDG